MAFYYRVDFQQGYYKYYKTYEASILTFIKKLIEIDSDALFATSVKMLKKEPTQEYFEMLD